MNVKHLLQCHNWCVTSQAAVSRSISDSLKEAIVTQYNSSSSLRSTSLIAWRQGATINTPIYREFSAKESLATQMYQSCVRNSSQCNTCSVRNTTQTDWLSGNRHAHTGRQSNVSLHSLCTTNRVTTKYACVVDDLDIERSDSNVDNEHSVSRLHSVSG